MSDENLIPEYDKSNWRKGPWDNEPDRKDFIHNGYSCLMLRNGYGNWCGYVGIPSTHPYYGVNYDDVNVDVHGGLTYADVCRDHICHIPEAGMPDNVWWLGFDTGHFDDMSPSRYMSDSTFSTYKDMDYVEKETRCLADQLKKLEVTDEAEAEAE